MALRLFKRHFGGQEGKDKGNLSFTVVLALLFRK